LSAVRFGGSVSPGIHRVVDAREVHVGEFLRQLLDVVGEQEADAEHELRAARRELPQRSLAVVALVHLDRRVVDAELALGALEPA
jgi:hypothetical protein